MNKHCIEGKEPLNNSKHYLKIMRIVLFFLFFCILFSSASNSYSQEFTIKSKTASIKEVCREIEKNSDFIFVFSDNSEKLIDKKVNVEANSKDVTEVLDAVLSSTGLTYKILDKQIVVYKSTGSAPSVAVEQPDINIIQQPAKKQITGRVVDALGEAIIGANIIETGTTNGTVTDIDGKFSLSVEDNATIRISYIGYLEQSINTVERTSFNITLLEDTQALEEVVVVGYAVQKKESLVGAVSKLKGEVLESRGGVTNLSTALTGQIPGVTIIEGSGEPGRDDPEIIIRGMSTWNSSAPLILVDGIERKMNDIRPKDVATISVLKDASATAVFGVKGANGVILITTKRGTLGKPTLSFTANTAIKTISKLNLLMDSYDARKFKNEGIEREVNFSESTWDYYTPMEELEFFKKPQVAPYTYLYPNVDWVDIITRDFQVSSSFGMDLRGGTDFVKYFVSLGYSNDGDILNSTFQDDRGYRPGFGYSRFNFRNNLDFTLTKTTTLSANLTGYVGRQKGNYADSGIEPQQGQHGPLYTSAPITSSLYFTAPDALYPKYDDGFYGMGQDGLGGTNPLALLDRGGVRYTNRNHIGADIKLEQKLDFIIPGLSTNLNVSWDGYAASNGPGISESSNSGMAQYQYISPEILLAYTREDSLRAIQRYNSLNLVGINEFDFTIRPWQPVAESVLSGYLQRSLFYQASLNYSRVFGKHAVTGLALFNRREDAMGSVFANYREDWVGRLTYDYDGRYMGEVNGAYNGSEKFGPDYRFGFFPSAAVGWNISNESFMKNVIWLDILKIRGSIGKIGSDAGIPRWSYLSSWIKGTGMGQYVTVPMHQFFLGQNEAIFINSPYTAYYEGTIANPAIRWETSIKKNIGVDFAAFNNSLTLEMDFYKEDRTDIFLSSSQRNVPEYFGAPAIPANLGETTTKGYEISVGYRKENYTGFGYSFLVSLTSATDKILAMEDPILMDAYLKREGFQIGQPKTTLNAGFMNNWDDVYASTPASTNMDWRLPGDWDMVDYNGDGLDTWDAVPWGYPVRPQNTYSAHLTFSYKKLSLLLQFYAINKTNLDVFPQQAEPYRHTAVAAWLDDYWTPENTDASFRAPRVGYKTDIYNYNLFNGSYVRLKTAEIAYLLDNEWIKSAGVSALRLFINGNNLLYWSTMPMDTERNFSSADTYPRYKQFNMGLEISF